MLKLKNMSTRNIKVRNCWSKRTIKVKKIIVEKLGK